MPIAPAGLGPLSDPRCFTEPVSIAGRSHEELRADLAMMLTIRFAEEAIAELVENGEARCPCHLGIGQEAIAVGVSANLRPADRVFGAHRSHAHYLALGGDLDAMMAEVLGKDVGCSRGFGGSMHLYGGEVGFRGSVPIVAATVPIAAGAALAAKMDGNEDVAVSYFGDGAAEEGGIHESLNLAAIMALPILFVCENNLYSSHLDIGQRQPSDRIARFAEAHCIPARVVDGNDVSAVREAATALVEHARRGGGPGFLEAVTYRWRGHVGPKEDVDVGVRRSAEDLAAWKKRDPVGRLRAAMIARGDVGDEELEALADERRAAVQSAVEAARRAPYPPAAALHRAVYADRGGDIG